MPFELPALDDSAFTMIEILGFVLTAEGGEGKKG
jgi:hypothetical protein